jgi:hypothetical protein
VYALPTAGRSAHRIVPHQLEPTLEGNPWNCPHRPGAGRSPFAIAAAGGAGERAIPEYLLGFYPTHERAPEIPEQKIDNDQQPPTGSE